MDKRDLRIVYMGTPDFAVESLRVLVENGYNVVGVVTMPDKPIGRGYKVKSSPVKEYALSKNIPILQPEQLKDDSFLDKLKELRADLQIVVAFRMLPEVVWKMPRLGTFNLHASLLPQYRGAAPINWVIINGETETGVTTFFLQHEIDTGNIILQEKIRIEPQDNAGSVHDKLMVLGAKTVLRTVDLILSNSVCSLPQKNDSSLKSAPKIFKETCRIDWQKEGKKIVDFVRGMSPFPGAFFEWTDSDGTISAVKIFDSAYESITHNFSIGTILIDKKSFKIAIRDGMLSIFVLQLPGKKRMRVEEFLRGIKDLEHFRLNF